MKLGRLKFQSCNNLCHKESWPGIADRKLLSCDFGEAGGWRVRDNKPSRQSILIISIISILVLYGLLYIIFSKFC